MAAVRFISTLTTGIDNIQGTTGNDKVVASVTNVAATETLQAGDAINGGAGTDTLQIVASGTPVAALVPTLTSVENIDVSAFAGVGLNLVNSTGVENISVSNGTGVVTVGGLNNLVDLAASNTTNGGLTVNYAGAAAAGTADVQKVTLNNASANPAAGGLTAINVGGVETFAFDVAGKNNISLTGAAANTVTVAGAGSLDIAAVGNSVKTFDASANTGGVTAAFTAGADVKATGGAGADSFDFAGGFTKADVVDGGEGIDTVRVALGTADLTAATATEAYNALKNVERVAFDGTGGVTVNGSTFTNAAVTNLQFNTAGNDVINNAGSARTYEFGTSNAGSATFALAAGATALNIDLLGTAGTAAANDGADADVAGLTITTAGVNSTTTPVTVNLTSAGDLADAIYSGGTFQEGNFNQTGLVTVASGSTVTVDGDGNLAIFGGAAGTVSEGFDNNVTLNTSALTGNTILAGSSFDSASVGVVSTGANGVNTPLTQGVDSFTLGAGKDVIVFADGLASGVIQIATPAGGTASADAAVNGNILVDTITGFQAGANGDMLFFGTDLADAVAADDHTAIQATTQAAINALSGNQATLQGAANLAAADAAGAWTAFSFQGETYALYDANNVGTTFTNDDILVRLTGVNVADLTDANFAV